MSYWTKVKSFSGCYEKPSSKAEWKERAGWDTVIIQMEISSCVKKEKRELDRHIHTRPCFLTSAHLASHCMMRVWLLDYFRKLQTLLYKDHLTPLWRMCDGPWFHMLSDRPRLKVTVQEDRCCTTLWQMLCCYTDSTATEKQLRSKFTCCQLLKSKHWSSKLGPVPGSGFRWKHWIW